MLVRYERPMPDLSHTITAPLLLDFGGQHGVEIERWSLEGLEPPVHLAADNGMAWLTIPFQGFGITFRVCLRRDPATGLLRFEHLGPREARVLRHFYRALVSGRAVPLEGMITAMDTPVEPVPMTQTPAEIEAQAGRTPPRVLRIAAAVALYGLLGTLAFGPLVDPLSRQVAAQLGPAGAYAGSGAPSVP
jgi:hypothetical protein